MSLGGRGMGIGSVDGMDWQGDYRGGGAGGQVEGVQLRVQVSDQRVRVERERSQVCVGDARRAERDAAGPASARERVELAKLSLAEPGATETSGGEAGSERGSGDVAIDWQQTLLLCCCGRRWYYLLRKLMRTISRHRTNRSALREVAACQDKVRSRQELMVWTSRHLRLATGKLNYCNLSTLTAHACHTALPPKWYLLLAVYLPTLVATSSNRMEIV